MKNQGQEKEGPGCPNETVKLIKWDTTQEIKEFKNYIFIVIWEVTATIKFKRKDGI